MTDQTPIRAFIAIELPEAIKREVASLQQRLAVQPDKGIKWAGPENVHLTLKFLGAVEPKRIDAIKSALAQAAAGFRPFELRLEGLGGFPNLRRINVVWCGLTGDLESLSRLQQSVETLVSPLGFPTEKRAFSPHLTLARLREDAAPEARRVLGDKLATTRFESALTIKIESVNLMQSTLLPTGAIYTRLAGFSLKA